METTRRDFLMVGTKLLVMTAATASALEHVLAGTPEAVQRPYNTADHWWAMLIDVEKCIGGGHCVRACKTENNVLDEPMYFRTWVERYHIDMSDPDHPIVDSPERRHRRVPRDSTRTATGKTFFVPEDVQPLRGLAVHAGLPGRRDVPHQRRRRADRQGLLRRLPLLRAGVSLRLPLSRSADAHRRQVHALLSPHHEGVEDRPAVEVCPTGARQIADLKNPNDPVTNSCARTRSRC